MQYKNVNGILKKMSIYFIGNLSTKLLSVLLVPIYAYFVSVAELGEYDYITAVSSVVSPIVYCVIWEAILRYCINNCNTNERDKVISTSIVFAVCMTFVSAVLFLVIFLLGGHSLSLLFILFFSITQGFVSIWQFAARSFGENKWYVISSIIGAATIIGIELLFVVFGRLNCTALCVANLISQILIVVVLEHRINILKKVKIREVDFRLLRKILLFTIPLVINNVSLYLYNSGSKMIIKNYIGAYENGLYSFASKFSMLISLFSTVVSMAVIEEAYSFNSLEEYKTKMSLLITKISKGYLSLVIVALPAIYILYSIAFNKTEYYPSVDYIFLLLAGALFTALSNNFGSAFQVTDNTKYISITTIIGAVCAIAFSLSSVSKIGIVGVLLGGAIGPFVMMMSRAIYAKKTTGLLVSWKLLLGLLIFSVIEYFLLMRMNTLSIYLIILFISTGFVYFINRKDIKVFISNIFGKGK